MSRPDPPPNIADWWELVSLPVTAVWERYRDYGAEFEDLAQEAAAWWYGPGRRYVVEYLADGAPHRRLRRSIWRHCDRHGRAWRAAVIGYEPADEVRYGPGEIIGLLPVAFDIELLPDATGPREDEHGPRPPGNPAEGGNLLATVLDIRRALEHGLHPADHAFLKQAELLNRDWVKLGRRHDLTSDAAYRKHRRLAQRIARWLNNEVEQP